MAITEDLINFDIIETHKENIQSLPGGRSAKALASRFSPNGLNSPTPGDTRNLNDAIRHEYELELNSIADSDDPLDIYDRYVKWTFGAYPSAQATPESQLRPLLERATKAFQSDPRYKSDPRYLKLWLNYIRFFSDSPRETFAYLSRHSIGEGLALFYEEFGAWLEGAGRWRQADEVYKLGIEREARPTERIARKFGEFQQRYDARPQDADEPSSPALPTVRPVLIAKIDPFASTPRNTNPQAPTPSNGIGGASRPRGGKQKLAIFSDADAPESASRPATGDSSKGWENIGTVSDRKKENVMEARSWTGETLKAGTRKTTAPKMAIFKDETGSQIATTNANHSSRYADQQQITNPRTGKAERVFVNLEAVYPNDHDEMSFDELRAKARGWFHRDWAAEAQQQKAEEASARARTEASIVAAKESQALDYAFKYSGSQQSNDSPNSNHDSTRTLDLGHTTTLDLGHTVAIDIGQEVKAGRPKKIRIKEVKGETQTIKTNLSSPTGPKLRRKTSAEPTITLHTKAATEDILDIFNQPLRNVDPLAIPQEEEGDTDYDDEDDYTSGGESTGTGKISGTSDFGDTQLDVNVGTTDSESGPASVSPWSDFTASKHVPKHDDIEDEDIADKVDETSTVASENQSNSVDDTNDSTAERAFVVHEDSTQKDPVDGDEADVVTPILPLDNTENEVPRTRYIPLPPEDYKPPVRYVRDPEEVAQNRLPFMTPILEKTESSMGAFTVRPDKDYFNSKTPSRKGNGYERPLIGEEVLSSPFREIINEARPQSIPKLKIATSRPTPKSVAKPQDGPIIQDLQCNPVDDSIRKTILETIQPPLSFYPGYHDYRPSSFNKGPEIRKHINALKKTKSDGKTTTSLSIPPTIQFPSSTSDTYTIKRELGKGAFAPVYLAEVSNVSADAEDGDDHEASPNPLLAIKCEDPPTPWEFYIMSTLRSRLSSSPLSSTLHPSTLPSLCTPTALHLFGDEAYLLESYLDQGTLLDLINLAKSDPTASQPTLDEPIAMFFTTELLRTVEAMHAAGILHGDLKADNCLVRLPSTPATEEWSPQYCADGSGGWASKGLTLIDFGRGIDLRAFRPEVQFLADWKTGKQDCVEMRQLRPWTYQVDYWGMAGVVHSLLFGKYIEDVVVDEPASRKSTAVHKHNFDGDDDDDDDENVTPLSPTAAADKTIPIPTTTHRRTRLREPLKRYWQTHLWSSLFDLLLNPGCAAEGIPCTRSLRECRVAMECWLAGEGGRKGAGGLKGGVGRLAARVGAREKGRSGR